MGPRGYLVTPEEEAIDALIMVFCWALMALAIPLCIEIGNVWWGILIGGNIFIAAVGFTLPYFLLSVPEACSAIVIDLATQATEEDRYKNQKVYVTGLHIRRFWTQIKNGLFINERLVTIKKPEDFVTRTGPKVTAKITIQYRLVPEFAPRYIATDEATIETGLLNILTQTATVEIKKLELEEAILRVAEIQETLRIAFEEGPRIVNDTSLEVRRAMRLPVVAGIKPGSIEWLYGIDIVLVRIDDLDPETDYQKILTSRATGARLREMTEQFVATGMTPKDANNAALLVTSAVTGVKKTIFEVEGLRDVTDALANALISIFGRRNRRN